MQPTLVRLDVAGHTHRLQALLLFKKVLIKR